MFLNGGTLPRSHQSIQNTAKTAVNNENSSCLHPRISAKLSSENTAISAPTKKISFSSTRAPKGNSGAKTKTPHFKGRTSSNASAHSSRRRRALGDISNRKGGGNSSTIAFPSDSKSSSLGRKPLTDHNKVSFQKTKIPKSKLSSSFLLKPTQSNTHGTGRGVRAPVNDNFVLPKRTTPAKVKANLKSKPILNETKSKAHVLAHGTSASVLKLPASENDEIFGVTTRWAPDCVDDRDAVPCVSKEELEEGHQLREEIFRSMEEDDIKMEALEEKFHNENFQKQILAAKEIMDQDIADLVVITGATETIQNIEEDYLKLVERQLSIGGIEDPEEHRRLPDSDPLSMWDDI